MIYINEKVIDDDSILVQVEGSLDEESTALLKRICQSHLKSSKNIELNLEGLYYISRAGREYLKEIKNKVLIGNLEEIA